MSKLAIFEACVLDETLKGNTCGCKVVISALYFFGTTTTIIMALVPGDRGYRTTRLTTEIACLFTATTVRLVTIR